MFRWEFSASSKSIYLHGKENRYFIWSHLSEKSKLCFINNISKIDESGNNTTTTLDITTDTNTIITNIVTISISNGSVVTIINNDATRFTITTNNY